MLHHECSAMPTVYIFNIRVVGILQMFAVHHHKHHIRGGEEKPHDDAYCIGIDLSICLANHIGKSYKFVNPIRLA